MKILSEFKQFASRGNVVDLAVGIIIGAAFGKIVTSLVGDVILPPLGVLIGGVSFTDFKIVMTDPVIDATGKIIKQAASLNYGSFLQSIFDFIIVSFAVFIMIKAMNKINKKKEETKVDPTPTKQEELLTEIRDLLKKPTQK
jgi:large conductance mechanosensitive channel